MAFGIDDAIAAGLQVLNKFIPDPAEKAKAESELRSALLQWDQAQNRSIFVAGWRPAIGWCCAFALFYQYLAVPLSMWATTWSGHPFPRPPILDDTMWQLMFGLLGMGGLRTYEKIKGVTK
jgi:Holin of 3TMs, for gene-transfer release